MALTSNFLKKQVDLPVWEQLRYAPAVSSAISDACSADNSNFHIQHGRYIYYLIAAAGFWRYDTWTDMYMQLSSPAITPATWAAIRFAGSLGVEGLALAGGTNTITIPAYYGKVLKSFDIRIIAGLGVGQRRVITDVAEPVIAETGVATAIANALGGITITDSTKNWAFNYWAGYQVRIYSGSGISQIRRVLYNSATVLTLGDSVISARETFCNPNIFSPAIAITAGLQSVYVIESSVVTVDSNWGTAPDATSIFRIESGSIFLYSSAAATPFYTVQQYDIATDTWYIRTANTLGVSAVGTDGTCERTTENASVWARGKATGGTVNTLIDTGKNWVVDQWVGYYVRIFSGTGENQLRVVSANTANTLTWVTAGTAPDTTSYYLIDGFDSGTPTSATSSSITDSTKAWTVNRWTNYSVRITSGTGKGQVIPIVSNTATALTLLYAATVTLDTTSLYCIQADIDKNYLAMGGNSSILIHNLDDDIGSYGRRVDGGAARIASVQYSGRKPIGITSATHVTTTATITTAIAHGLKVGWSITVRGFTDANYNTTATIVTVPSATTFTYVMSGTPSVDTIVGSHSTSTLCDATKTWTTNQWAGYVCYMTTSAVTAASGLTTGQAMQIASNTATTLTFTGVATAAPTNGVSRYVICKRAIIGSISDGLATGTQSTTTLQDTNKAATLTGSMTSGLFVLTVSVIATNSLELGMSITGTSIPTGTVIINQLTGTPGGVGTYTLSRAATAGISGATINYAWVVNFFAGRRLKMLGATGQAQEIPVLSNTSNTLTWLTAGTAPVTLMTPYVIMHQQMRGLGVAMNWGFGTSNLAIRGKYFFIPRGGAVLGFDRWDMTTDQIDLMPITPQIETLTTGSMYAYDGGDRLYFTKEATLRVYYLDLTTNTLHGAGMIPYLAGTAIIGNRMEIFTTEDGLKYLWINRHSLQDCYRALLFW
jgi:hypothetical protein